MKQEDIKDIVSIIDSSTETCKGYQQNAGKVTSDTLLHLYAKELGNIQGMMIVLADHAAIPPEIRASLKQLYEVLKRI